MPKHANQTSFKTGKDHIYWKGGTFDYWRREARKKVNCPKGMVVHHINRNPLDNSSENLQILTPSEHATIHGRQRKGLLRLNSKIRKVIRKVLELQKQGYLRKEIAIMVGINFRMVKRCLSTEWKSQYE